jgi:hypothetical protein
LRLVNVGIGLVSKTLTTVLGGQMLRDVQTFVNALDTMFGGFRERADLTYALAQGGRDRLRRRRGTGAGRAARGQLLRGAAGAGGYAARRRRRQPDAADPRPGLSAERARAAAEQLADADRWDSAAALTLHATMSDLGGPAPKPGAPLHRRPPVDPCCRGGLVAQDVHDVDGLREIGSRLAG